MGVKIQLINCASWGAKKPRSGLVTIPASKKIIFHHTAGHHANITNPGQQSRAESVRYAQSIQNYHMSLGWTDSGHNFLICRNGLILQGRWLTISAIAANHMIQSAHCPGQNDQIGIEHEHYGAELSTKEQRESSARLMAWIADKYDLKYVLPIDPHSKHFATSCPANLLHDIPEIKRRAQIILDAEGDQFKV